MPVYYDPFGRPVRAPGPTSGRSPRQVPVEEYQRLLHVVEQLQGEVRELRTAETEAQQRIRELGEKLAQKEQILGVLKEKLNETQDALEEQQAAWERARQESQTETLWKERLARLQAEVENMRRRSEERIAQGIAESRDQILLDMIPVADHLEMALQHQNALGDSDAAATFLDNIRATYQAFLAALGRYGVQQIDALGEPFDPTVHEALGHTPSTEYGPETVAHVLQRGYRDGDRLIRPARVMVSSGAPQ